MTLLDTHAWVWWLSDPARLSSTAREHVDAAVEGNGVLISAISAWEIALLVKKGRLELSTTVERWVTRSQALPFLQFVPVDPKIAVSSVQLSGSLHEDPADRIIVATAMALGTVLVTRDARLQAFSGVTTVW